MPEKKKRVYISWDKKEKKEPRAWLARHKHLPWKKIREEYLRQKKKPRSIHSIRSNSDQLERELNPPVKEKETTKDIGSHYPPSLVSQGDLLNVRAVCRNFNEICEPIIYRFLVQEILTRRHFHLHRAAPSRRMNSILRLIEDGAPVTQKMKRGRLRYTLHREMVMLLVLRL